ncbi:MAG: alpha/beta fold hydrolase [Salinibacterium sp.]|nr:alpha/beta fold hydrolase [Salinibacterium sp.]
MIRRLPLLVAMTAVAMVVLAGCQLLPTSLRPSDPPATTSDGFYAQTLTWKSCGKGQECATAKAPIDWNSPADGAIDLALVKHLATGTKQGSMLLNPGGPGGSGWDFVYYSGDSVAGPAVVDAFDIVGWDPRGVGRSTGVTCFTDDKAKDDQLYGTFDSPYDTQGWIDELTVEMESFAAACEKNTGELLGNLDAASNAKDMDMLRALLGDKKLNYLGYSYGTYFGSVYAELFPQNVGRFVLDGAVDPLQTDFESLKFQMVGFDSGLRAYMEDCLSRSGCPFSGSVDSALAQVRSALDTVDGLKLVNADGRVLDSATLATAIIENLYSQSFWVDLSNMFADLRGGNPALTFKSADDYNQRSSNGTYESNANDVYIAATCADGDFASDPQSTLDRIAEIDAAAPILGKYATYDDFAVLDTACTHWPYPRGVDLPTTFEAVGAGPILVIGTTNDPATPYASSVSLARQLSSGVLITHTGEGHTVYNQGVSCIDDLVDAYFVNGTVPAADPMC